jgi:hypothetical protein
MVRLAESTAGTVFGFNFADERPSMDELTSRPKKASGRMATSYLTLL